MESFLYAIRVSCADPFPDQLSIIRTYFSPTRPPDTNLFTHWLCYLGPAPGHQAGSSKLVLSISQMSKDNGKKLRRETVKRVHDDDWLGWGIMDRSFECAHEDTL